MTDRRWATRLAEWIAWNHEEVESSIRAVAATLISVRPSPSAPSVGFHAWHLGRWVDRHIATISAAIDPTSPEPEVWIARDLTAHWGLVGVDLGKHGGTGEGLDDAASAALALPGVDEILDYVTGTFRTFEEVLARIPDDAFLEQSFVDPYGDLTTTGDGLLNHLSHADRHLGMIEALRGVLGERGTATV